MGELERAPAPPSNTGFRLVVCGICLCAFTPLIWSVSRWLVFLFVPADKVASTRDTVDLVGGIVVAVLLGLGFNYITWKYVESRWLRWLVFGIEGVVAAIIVLSLLDSRPTTPP